MLVSTESASATANLDRIFQSQREAFRRHSNPSLAERKAHLDALHQLLAENCDSLADAINADYGCRSPRETKLLELFPALEAVKHARANVAKWMRPERKPVSLWYRFGHAVVLKQPLGVIGIVVPWNYPLYLSAVPLVSVLAAGNRAIIRISETSSHTAALLARLVAMYFDEDHVAVVEGDVDVAKALVAKPLDHLLFTGSTSIAHDVMHAAAENLTPITLELGGKTPAIIAPGYPIDLAAQRILWGKCLNAGQTCVAPDYVLLPDTQVEAFLGAALAAVRHFYPDGALSADYTSIITDHHFERLTDLLYDARSKGARIVCLAEGRSESDRKFPPTAVCDVTDEMDLMQEEIFGPLLPIVTYRNLEQALDFVNVRTPALAMYYFDHDNARIRRVLHDTTAGGVTVNDTLLHVAQNELPFGGVGASGMGEYHGEAGFHRFSKQKGVFLQSRVNGMSFLNPPFGRLFDALISQVLR